MVLGFRIIIECYAKSDAVPSLDTFCRDENVKIRTSASIQSDWPVTVVTEPNLFRTDTNRYPPLLSHDCPRIKAAAEWGKKK